MHSDCEDAHQSETSEGEICENTHQRGRTCADKDDAQRKFAKEMGEEIKERVEKAATKGELFYTNLADDLIDLFEQWAEEERGRVEAAAEKAMKTEAGPSPAETGDLEDPQTAYKNEVREQHGADA